MPQRPDGDAVGGDAGVEPVSDDFMSIGLAAEHAEALVGRDAISARHRRA